MGEHIGLFQSMEKLALRLVARGSNGKLDASLSVHLFRLDADHVHSDRQNLLEIHKHVGPIKAFRIDNRVNKGGALVKLRILDRKSTRLNSSHSQISYAVF